jgi:glutathione peroxidase-family protein
MRTIFFALFMMSSTAFARDLYAVKEKSIEGTDYNFADLKNKVVLITNIASQCGYTPQLEKLEKLHRQYKGKDLVVLGVPTNDFGGQTPEDDKGMKEFCKKKYDVTFPLLNKKTVKDAEKRDLYKYLTEESAKEFNGKIGWNFEKFLINKKGIVVARFGSNVDPLDPEITKQIDTLLK